MAIQFSVATRNARLDAIETVISAGGAPTLKIWTGAAPANCATADSGTQLATITLNTDWLAAAASGQKAITNDPWTDSSADAAGTAGHFRVYDNGGTCHLQGTVTGSGGGGDMELDNTSIEALQPVNITTFTLTDGNA